MVAVDLDRLYRTPPAGSDLLADRLLAAPPEVAADGTALGAELLALADNPFDWLLDVEAGA